MPSETADQTWHESLWRHAQPSSQGNPALKGHKTADVTIVGAGFTGLHAANVLAENGMDVLMLDAKDVGYGASGRNGGQVNPMLPFNSPDRIRRLVGSRHFEKLAKASLESADALFRLIETYQIRCNARQHGWLRVLHSAKALEAARTDCRNWNELGGDMRLIEGPEVARISGSPRYKAGVITARGGAVQPFDLVCGLARVAKSAGVRIFGNSAALRTKASAGKWVVETKDGSVTSNWLIVATNGYSDKLIPGLAQSIVPLSPIQIATEPLPDDVYNSILPQGHTISDSRRIIMYARREPENRIVYGGLGRLRAGKLQGFDWLKKDAVRVFPQLAQAKWAHEWGGTIAVTADHLPHVHEPQSKLLVGLGYNGRGVAMSLVVGRTLAERILGADEDDLALPVTQIAPFPMRSFKLFGMDTAISTMRLMDRLEFR